MTIVASRPPPYDAIDKISFTLVKRNSNYHFLF